jgi:hypothetical protein
MSITEVKEALPPVLVRLPDGAIKPGILAGRSLPYAQVAVDGRFVGEWSWESVTRAITNNRPLIV